MSSYGGGPWDGRGWTEGPPGAEGDYQAGYSQQQAANSWGATNYGQYPPGYDYSAYQQAAAYSGYSYDPAYYQQSSEYYAKYGYQQPGQVGSTGQPYNKNYPPTQSSTKKLSRSPVKSRSPIKSRDYKRKSSSRSLTPVRERSRGHSARKYTKAKSRRHSTSSSSSRSTRSSRSRRRKHSRSSHSSSRSVSSSSSHDKRQTKSKVIPTKKPMSKDNIDKYSKSKSSRHSHAEMEKVKIKVEPKSPERKLPQKKKREGTPITPPRSYKIKEKSITPPKSYKIREKSATPDKGRTHSTDSNRTSDNSVSTPRTSKKRTKKSNSQSSSRSVSPPARSHSNRKTRSSSYIRKGSHSSSRSRSRSYETSRSTRRRKSRSFSAESNSKDRNSKNLRSRSKRCQRSRDRSKRSRSDSGSEERRRGDKRRRTRSRSHSRSRSRSRSDSSSRGQFTGYDRKRYFKKFNAMKKSPSPKETKVEPPPGAIEPEKTDDIQYSDPPDLDGVNFADLPPPPEQLFKKSNKPQVPLFIRNDGSFLEMFKKMQEETKPPAASTSQAETKPEMKKPALPFIGKRRGGRVLKTGLVKKAKAIDEQLVDNTPKDAWSLYMQEVKKYRETSCEEERKTRPLVK